MRYELYYWPGIQGRGEYVRLALEEGGADYRDVVLAPEEQGGGIAAMMRWMEGADVARPPLAPPFLRAGRQLIGQTANILLFLGPRLRLVPRSAADQLWIHQLQLTIADFVAEIHDTHHPLGVDLYYEQQKAPARRRARQFREQRLPKFLDYFERVIERNAAAGPWMVGRQRTYVDLSMAQVVAGLRYAFPQAAAGALRRCPRLRELHDAVFARPRIRRYVLSGRRPAFSDEDIFRRYRELDG